MFKMPVNQEINSQDERIGSGLNQVTITILFQQRVAKMSTTACRFDYKNHKCL